MNRVCLLIGIAAMCGCGIRRPFPGGGPLGSTTTLPTRESPVDEVFPPKTNVPPAIPPVIVDAPADPPVVESRSVPNLDATIQTANGQLEDVFFAYDHFDLSPEATAALQHDAALLRDVLRDFPTLVISVEGHCDERGSAEYNLALGDHRATRAVDLLTRLGLPAANFSPVSYGKEYPQCSESSESCWQRNRRAHLVVRPRPTD